MGLKVTFPPQASKALKEMADEEGVTVAELIRMAVNFYGLRLECHRNHKKLILEDEYGNRQLVIT